MLIEIVSIGDELLKGRVVNTNAAFLCKNLRMQGYAVSSQTTISDDMQQLRLGLKGSLARADLVIATGGLGPTLDDRTREVAAELFGSDFYENTAIAEELKSRYADRYFAVKDQSRVPCKASILPNSVGSAPGLVFSEQGKTLILLPGVPQEMEPLFLEEVLPFLRMRYPSVQKETVLLFFCLIYESLLDPHLRTLSSQYLSVEVGIYPSSGTVTVSLSGVNSSELLAFKRILEARFGSYQYVAPSGKIEEALYLACTKRHKKIACAESCTGGRISAAITSVAGASDYFLGSLVTYSNKMKMDLLNVSEQTLDQRGAVSQETVTEMLQGVFNRTEADFAIAVSGVAGPTGGSRETPVGVVYAAIGERGEPPEVGFFRVSGNRDKIASTAGIYLIGALWRKIEKGERVFPLVDLSLF